MTKPILIKAGDKRVRIGREMKPPKVDCRIISEYTYQKMVKMLEDASHLVGSPRVGISSSTDIACEKWGKEYKDWSGSDKNKIS